MLLTTVSCVAVMSVVPASMAVARPRESMVATAVSELSHVAVEAAYYENVEEDIARLLADDAVVARFNGRMEYGPRALGNRTILYRPNDPSVNYWMNDALKRTEFMPFAPVSLTEESHKLFKGLKGAENTARFMTITFDCTDWMAENCPGVVHIDNTARPQLVDSNDNPSMHRVLGEYQKLTGLPCLINTSFNMHEEPIVCSRMTRYARSKWDNWTIWPSATG